MEEKTIQILDINSKVITPKPGQTFKTFTVYSIKSRDNKVYETTDRDFTSKLAIGESITIKYITKSRIYNGQTYYQYKIITPSLQEGIIERLNKMESNILAAIRLSCGEIKIPDKEIVNKPMGNSGSTLPLPLKTEETVPIDQPEAPGSDINEELDVVTEEDNPFS